MGFNWANYAQIAWCWGHGSSELLGPICRNFHRQLGWGSRGNEREGPGCVDLISSLGRQGQQKTTPKSSKCTRPILYNLTYYMNVIVFMSPFPPFLVPLQGTMDWSWSLPNLTLFKVPIPILEVQIPIIQTMQIIKLIHNVRKDGTLFSKDNSCSQIYENCHCENCFKCFYKKWYPACPSV